MEDAVVPQAEHVERSSATDERELRAIRNGVRKLCERFPGEYWQGLEPDRYPEEFVKALTDEGWLAALIPEEYGGSGLPLGAGSVILEQIGHSGCNAGACH